MRSSDNHLTAISLDKPQPSSTKIRWKVTYLKCHSNIMGPISEKTYSIFIRMCSWVTVWVNNLGFCFESLKNTVKPVSNMIKRFNTTPMESERVRRYLIIFFPQNTHKKLSRARCGVFLVSSLFVLVSLLLILTLPVAFHYIRPCYNGGTHSNKKYAPVWGVSS